MLRIFVNTLAAVNTVLSALHVAASFNTVRCGGLVKRAKSSPTGQGAPAQGRIMLKKTCNEATSSSHGAKGDHKFCFFFFYPTADGEK